MIAYGCYCTAIVLFVVTICANFVPFEQIMRVGISRGDVLLAIPLFLIAGAIHGQRFQKERRTDG